MGNFYSEMRSLVSKPNDVQRYTTTHDNGKPKTDTRFRDGKLDSTLSLYDDGTIMDEFRCNYDVKLCLYRTYWRNGNLRRKAWYNMDGELDGKEEWFHEDGSKFGECHHEKGQKHGVETTWHSGGKPLP